ETVAYALGLGLFVATIVGAVPGLQATRRGIEPDLRQLGGATGLRLGRMWTALVVAQVAVAIAILPAAMKTTLHEARDAFTRATYPTDEILTGALTAKRAQASADEKAQPFGPRLGDVVRKLRPLVAGVGFIGGAPGSGG